MDLALLPGSGSGIIVSDPAKNERSDFISHFKPVNSGLCTVGPYSRRRMETEAKANSRRCFFGGNGGPLRLCSRQFDKGWPGQ